MQQKHISHFMSTAGCWSSSEPHITEGPPSAVSSARHGFISCHDCSFMLQPRNEMLISTFIWLCVTVGWTRSSPSFCRKNKHLICLRPLFLNFHYNQMQFLSETIGTKFYKCTIECVRF
jgi:hypothetical protein